MQRIHEFTMTERPSDWLGGSAPKKEHVWHSPASKTKPSVKMPAGLPLSPSSVTAQPRADIVVERPNDFLGGCEVSEGSAVPHKTKLRTSWLKEMNNKHSSMPCVFDMPSQRRPNPNFLVKDRLSKLTKHFDEDSHKTGDLPPKHHSKNPNFLVKDRMAKLEIKKGDKDPKPTEEPTGRGYNKNSFLVQERLSKLCKKSDENHHKNDDLAVHHNGHAPSLHKKEVPKKEEKQEHHASSNPQIEVQRDAYLAERPTGWLGGGEPSEDLYHHDEPHHKARSRPSWMLHTNAKGSMSMRNLYSKPEGLHHGTSSKIKEKLSAFQDEE